MAPASTKLIVAHRGDTSAAHENTLDAFRAAIANGADAIEFDVHVTADRVPVVHHDEVAAGRAIAAISHADLTSLRAGYSIPTLSEVIELVRGRLQLDIEIKAAGCEREVLDDIAAAGVSLDEVVVTSFQAGTLTRVRAIEPRMRTGWLVEKMSCAETLRAFEQSGADVLCPNYAIVDDEMMREAERRQVALLPWTVNEVVRMQWLLRAPAVMGIITDRLADALAARAATEDTKTT